VCFARSAFERDEAKKAAHALRLPVQAFDYF
jgi:hypothetical protein